MINQDTSTTKEELIILLQDLIQNIQTLPENEIEKKDIKFNLEKGTGYLLDDEDFHVWLVKFQKN